MSVLFTFSQGISKYCIDHKVCSRFVRLNEQEIFYFEDKQMSFIKDEDGFLPLFLPSSDTFANNQSDFFDAKSKGIRINSNSGKFYIVAEQLHGRILGSSNKTNNDHGQSQISYVDDDDVIYQEIHYNKLEEIGNKAQHIQLRAHETRNITQPKSQSLSSESHFHIKDIFLNDRALFQGTDKDNYVMVLKFNLTHIEDDADKQYCLAIPFFDIESIIESQSRNPYEIKNRDISGLVNLRGTVVEVFTLYQFLGIDLPNQTRRNSSIVLFKSDHGKIGIEVGNVAGVDVVKLYEQQTSCPVLEGFSKWAYKDDEEIIVLNLKDFANSLTQTG